MMHKVNAWFFETIRVYRMQLIIACSIGFIFGIHHLLIPQFLGVSDVYFPLSPTANNDATSYYAPRAWAVYNGDVNIVGDINLKEYSGSPATLAILNPIILGLMGRIFDSFRAALIVSDFLFPALIFLILYLLIFELTGRKFLSTVFSVLFIFMPRLGAYLPPPSWESTKNLIADLIPVGRFEGLYFSNFEYPKITFIFFALSLYFILRALKGNERYTVVAAGVSFGMLFYTYLYDWLYIGAGMFVMLILFLCMGRFSEVKKMCAIVGIGLAVSCVYWVNLFQLHALPSYHDILVRAEIEVSHAFRWLPWKAYLRNLILAVVLLRVWKKDHVSAVYVAGLLLSLVVVFNFHMVTGFQPQPYHWLIIAYVPVSIGILLFFLWLYERWGTFVPIGVFTATGWLVLGVLLTANLFSQYQFSRLHYAEFTVPQAYREAYEWLNTSTRNYRVVGSLSYVSNKELYLHTHTKVYLPNGMLTVAPTREIQERFMALNVLFGITQDEFSQRIRDMNLFHYLFHHQYPEWYPLNRDLGAVSGEEYAKRIEVVFQEKTAAYAAYLKSHTPVTLPYELDYVIVGPREKILVGQGFIPSSMHLSRVYDRNGVAIYTYGAKSSSSAMDDE